MGYGVRGMRYGETAQGKGQLLLVQMLFLGNYQDREVCVRCNDPDSRLIIELALLFEPKASCQRGAPDELTDSQINLPALTFWFFFVKKKEQKKKNLSRRRVSTRVFDRSNGSLKNLKP
jgi:hypothetical protein